jgi:hypothetical protein
MSQFFFVSIMSPPFKFFITQNSKLKCQFFLCNIVKIYGVWVLFYVTSRDYKKKLIWLIFERWFYNLFITKNKSEKINIFMCKKKIYYRLGLTILFWCISVLNFGLLKFKNWRHDGCTKNWGIWILLIFFFIDKI